MRVAGPWRRARGGAVAAMAALAVGAASPVLAQAQPPAAGPLAATSNGDPFERVNRGLFAFNGVLDRVLLRPVAMTYRRLLPRPVRRGVHNVLGNLDEPIVLANDLLQLRLRQAAQTAARFVGNTTVGILGVFDVATPAGLPHHDNSFGDTLGRAGVPVGPYLFLPAIGPTTVRELLGGAADFYIDPVAHLGGVNAQQVGIGQAVLGALDARVEADADIKSLEASAIDPYATARSAHLQQTAARLNGGEVPLDALPDIPPETAPAPPVPEAPTPTPDSPPEP
jgi:phospholipid-binding lipoprotein MlaA